MRKLRCDLFQPWISASHRRPQERSAASHVEYRSFKKGKQGRRKRAFPSPVRHINLYTALRNQTKEDTPKRTPRSSTSRRIAFLSKRSRLCADGDETEGWKLCFILIRVWALVMYSRQGARSASRLRERARRQKQTHQPGKRNDRESKSKVVGTDRYQTAIAHFYSRELVNGFVPLFPVRQRF